MTAGRTSLWYSSFTLAERNERRRGDREAVVRTTHKCTCVKGKAPGKGAAARRVKPLVAVGDEVVGAEFLEIERDLAHGMSAVDQHSRAVLVNQRYELFLFAGARIIDTESIERHNGHSIPLCGCVRTMGRIMPSGEMM
jgi:hypothetical protein